MSARALLALSLLLLVGCQSADRWTRRGDALVRAGDLEGAERAYSHALRLRPGHAPAMYGKGWALYASGLPELRSVAQQLFERSIEADPGFAGGYRGKAVLMMADQQVLAAETLLRQAYQLAPGDPAVLESYGQLYLAADRLEDAERVFQAAITAAPGRGELHRFLADVDLAADDPDAALAHIADGRRTGASTALGSTLLDEGEARILHEKARLAADGLLDGDDVGLATVLELLAQSDAVLAAAAGTDFAEDAREALAFANAELRSRLVPTPQEP
jgi:predicted Zn-dependent protease